MISLYKYKDRVIYKFIYPPVKSNMYIIPGNKDVLIIDPWQSDEAIEYLKLNKFTNVTVILTHEHYDHISGVNELKKNFKCNVIASNEAAIALQNPKKNLAAFIGCIFPDSVRVGKWRELYKVDEEFSCTADESFSGKMDIICVGLHFELVETPGHSPGSICIKLDNYVFTGDSLVGGKDIILRLPGSSKQRYKNITKPFLLSLSENTIVFPGHGMEGNIDRFNII